LRCAASRLALQPGSRRAGAAAIEADVPWLAPQRHSSDTARGRSTHPAAWDRAWWLAAANRECAFRRARLESPDREAREAVRACRIRRRDRTTPRRVLARGLPRFLPC